jgi:hypothetical protein
MPAQAAQEFPQALAGWHQAHRGVRQRGGGAWAVGSPPGWIMGGNKISKNIQGVGPLRRQAYVAVLVPDVVLCSSRAGHMYNVTIYNILRHTQPVTLFARRKDSSRYSITIILVV